MGQVGISIRDIDLMSLRELSNAIKGFYDLENQRAETLRDITYGASRYNAANTAMSKKAAKQISRQKFPWEGGGKPTRDDIISYDDVKGIFNAISE